MKRILVIEDNEINLKLFREILQYGGYMVIEAGNATEGIRRAKSEIPDLILMDIQMPDMDGVTAMGKIRETPELKDTPIIALTAYAMTGDRERFLSEGFIDHIPKPVDVVGLIETVKRYID